MSHEEVIHNVHFVYTLCTHLAPNRPLLFSHRYEHNRDIEAEFSLNHIYK